MNFGGGDVVYFDCHLDPPANEQGVVLGSPAKENFFSMKNGPYIKNWTCITVYSIKSAL